LSEDIEVKKLIDKMLRELMREKRRSMKVKEKLVVHLSDRNFDEALKKHKIVIVDFWAEWCMPCKFYAPIFEKVAEKLRGKALFAKLNVDENPITSMKYGITAIPTTIVFVNGRPAKQIIGVVDEATLLATIRKFLE